MLEKYYYQNKMYQFLGSDSGDDNNKFTIIVGKNGTGKSRLLSSIIGEFIGNPLPKNRYSNLEIPLNSNPKGYLEYRYLPTKIIAASSSPFDRFPLSRNLEHLEAYSYLGLRDLMSANFSLAYMSKIIEALLETMNQDSKQMFEIADVLKYLGYTDKIWINFEFRVNIKLREAVLGSQNPIQSFNEYFSNTDRIVQTYINKRFFYGIDKSLNEEKVYHFFKLLARVLPGNKRSIQIHINNSGIIFHNAFDGNVTDLIFLIQSGVIRLRDVFLERVNKEVYPISHASSGEQSVVMGILGIASQIKDYSLICIDEPEICLHPEWQERYIKILISTFDKYKGCHFFIATHSPQIISKLESSNCYILSMETGKAINAKHFINHSADYQLAHIFNAPGFKNEYLSRIALNVFTKVSKKKLFDIDDKQNYQMLISQIDFLEKTDPVYGLILAIKEMYQLYA